MKPKRKDSSPKETWQAERARYTWYLRPPYKDTFDCSHWWEAAPWWNSDSEKVKNPNKENQTAALYELVRRHPAVGEALRTEYTLTKPLPPPLPRVVWLLAKAPTCVGKPPLCLIRWPDIHQEDQKEFARSCATLKGIDHRSDSEKCFMVMPSEYDMALANKPHVPNPTAILELRGEEPVRVSFSPPGEPITQLDLEKSIGQQAAWAYRRGYLLLAVAPDLAEKDLDLLAKAYRAGKRKGKSRASRWLDWLTLITRFEKGEDFIHYKRVMDSVKFD